MAKRNSSATSHTCQVSLGAFTARKEKAKTPGNFQWEKGIFFGNTNKSDKYLMGTKKRFHTARSAKRLREDVRCSADFIEELMEVCWNALTSDIDWATKEGYWWR